MHLTTKGILHRLKVKKRLVTGYQLANALGVDTASTYRYMKYGRSMDVATAIRAAELMEEDPLIYVAAVELERARSESKRDILRKYAEKSLQLLENEQNHLCSNQNDATVRPAT